MDRMKGKVCVVTGGARGIGKAIVEKMAKEEATVVYALDMNEEALNELENAYSNVKGYVLNVTNRENIKEFVELAKNEYGRIDVLVNNAGITADALIQKMEEDAWDRVINVNLKGVFNMTQAVVPLMLENEKGSIVSISSIVGEKGNIGQTNYAATKGGVISMTYSWAKEFARKGANIRVNAVAPGFILTPMTEKMPEKVLNSIVEKVTLKRMGKATEVADAVFFLASEEASYITGHVLSVNGGTIL
ncbi:beta-ketoacyl-ACP reductase [Oceanotoga sp. DSM 15011]|uniref:beta-ketoacyl-ACP reductase n=1 Tax=Oceanotoga TaxID=1255275 RepID=UPI0021F3F695|nr:MULTISPECIES: beta-ketoacyl-ACP reductase [Oceanotoga]MDN5342958.1 3-oxoacyl-[acyl-carrier protein] reductase [Oceanotoga sp.]MDO7975311.1 beta-ketoacyl-ACP reductase [Oceanotoga teriensis]UYP00186.1 beta-ketoacyl-ACP reductase [Oceanotoga sp. DSM 15011]